MPQLRKSIVTALLFFFMAGLKPILGQAPIPEFLIAISPSAVTVVQGEQTGVTLTITCNTSSFIAVQDCNARPAFNIDLSEIPDGAYAQAAAGRIGANTILVGAASTATVGSFAVRVTVTAGDTTQAQTFLLNVRQGAQAPAAPQEIQQPVVALERPVLAWQYHLLVAKNPEEFDHAANELGQGSWELVSVVTKKNGDVVEWIGFFKRPKP